MIKLLILQILAHFISDFYLQTEKSCQDKMENGFKSLQLYLHVAITFLCSWLFSFLYPFTMSFWWAALIIALTHGILDGLKSVFKKVPWIFFIDQALHLVVIFVVVICFEKTVYYHIPFGYENVMTFFNRISMPTLLWFTAFTFCLRPANLFVREILENAHIKLPQANEAAQYEPEVAGDERVEDRVCVSNADRVIALVERVLILVFMLIGHFEVIGFLLLAKALVRFKDATTDKSEYALVGTLLSFSMAIVAGALVLCLLNIV